MSASERAEMVYECIRGGAEEYLIKPVTRKEVQNIWTHIIRRLSHTPAGAAPQQAPALAHLQPAHTSTNNDHTASATSGHLPLPLLPLAPLQTGPNNAIALHSSQAIPPFTMPVGPHSTQQQQQQQQLVSSLAMAAAGNATTEQQQQQQQQHWQAVQHMGGDGSGALATAGFQHNLHQQQQQQQLQQQGEGCAVQWRGGGQPPSKRMRLPDSSGVAGLGGGASGCVAGSAAGGVHIQPGLPQLNSGMGWRGGGGGLGVEGHSTQGVAGEGEMQQMGGLQGGMVVEATGRAERESGRLSFIV